MRLELQPTDIAWLALIAYVLGCNLVLREQLSMAVDRYLVSRRRTTELVLLALYAHLSNRIPTRYDPIHWLFLGLLRTAGRQRCEAGRSRYGSDCWLAAFRRRASSIRLC